MEGNEMKKTNFQKMDAAGTLSGGLAHDFNNLLQTIIGYSELVSLDLSKEENAYHYMETVKDAAWRGSEIPRQLLTVSKNTESKRKHLQLNGIIENVAKLLGRTIPKMISLELDLADDLCAVSADAAQLEQVLMNLAVNAKHAMPQSGLLHFETRNPELAGDFFRMPPNVDPGPYVLLSVTDTGCGMGERDPDLPVLLASGFAQNEASRKKMGDRVEFLGKPYHQKDFLREIRELLDREQKV